MANLAATAIQRAVRDVLEGGHGSSRTIASGTYKGALYEDQPQDQQVLKALSRPRLDIVVWSPGRHEFSPSTKGNLHLLMVMVEVRVVRSLETKHKLNDDERDQLYGAAARDADVIQQALTYPGNLSQDAEGNATGLVTSYLAWDSSSRPVITAGEQEQPSMVETTHTFAGTAQVTA